MGDVARLAGVSAQTVSCVTTGSDHVRPDTHAKVLRATSKPGYSPNRAAQTLRRGSFKTIGVLTQQIQYAGEAFTTAGMLEAAIAVDCAANLIQVERPASDDLCQAVYRLSHQVIDGFVMVQAGRANREHFVLPSSIPVAVSDFTFVDHYPSASADQAGGVRDAAEHLLGLGHRNIQYMCGSGDSQSNLIRRATQARCLRGAGLPVPEPIPSDWEAAVGYAADWLLVADSEVMTVFRANDELALDLTRAMHEQGKRVPSDVPAVGPDDFDVGEYSFPPLTTVRQDLRRHGCETVGLVLEQMAPGVRDDSRSIIIPTELILQGSTAPPLVT